MLKVELIGNLGADPELRTTSGGKSVTTLSVACTEGYGDNETTTWVRVNVWDKAAEACCNYLSKGSKVFVQGRLSYNEWTDKEGVLHKDAEVTASSYEGVIFLSGIKSNSESSSSSSSNGGRPGRRSRKVGDGHEAQV